VALLALVQSKPAPKTQPVEQTRSNARISLVERRYVGVKAISSSFHGKPIAMVARRLIHSRFNDTSQAHGMDGDG
jgi:hypothetical protein